MKIATFIDKEGLFEIGVLDDVFIGVFGSKIVFSLAVSTLTGDVTNTTKFTSIETLVSNFVFPPSSNIEKYIIENEPSLLSKISHTSPFTGKEYKPIEK